MPDSALTYDQIKNFCDKLGMVVNIQNDVAFRADMPREQDKWKRVLTRTLNEA